jgi:hypothetical protein
MLQGDPDGGPRPARGAHEPFSLRVAGRPCLRSATARLSRLLARCPVQPLAPAMLTHPDLGARSSGSTAASSGQSVPHEGGHADPSRPSRPSQGECAGARSGNRSLRQ